MTVPSWSYYLLRNMLRKLGYISWGRSEATTRCFHPSSRIPYPIPPWYFSCNDYCYVYIIDHTYQYPFWTSGGQRYHLRYGVGYRLNPHGCTGVPNYLSRLVHPQIHQGTGKCTHRCPGLGYHRASQRSCRLRMDISQSHYRSAVNNLSGEILSTDLVKYCPSQSLAYLYH